MHLEMQSQEQSSKKQKDSQRTYKSVPYSQAALPLPPSHVRLWSLSSCFPTCHTNASPVVPWRRRSGFAVKEARCQGLQRKFSAVAAAHRITLPCRLVFGSVSVSVGGHAWSCRESHVGSASSGNIKFRLLEGSLQWFAALGKCSLSLFPHFQRYLKFLLYRNVSSRKSIFHNF